MSEQTESSHTLERTKGCSFQEGKAGIWGANWLMRDMDWRRKHRSFCIIDNIATQRASFVQQPPILRAVISVVSTEVNADNDRWSDNIQTHLEFIATDQRSQFSISCRNETSASQHAMQFMYNSSSYIFPSFVHLCPSWLISSLVQTDDLFKNALFIFFDAIWYLVTLNNNAPLVHVS